jgi:DNA-binding transcriptional LysR family regulator
VFPDLDSIALFLRAVQLKSLSKAAEASHISLSAASRRLTLLEHQMGTALAYRLHSGVVATAAGEALVRHARTLLRDVELMQADLSDYARGSLGQVRLHANTSAMSQDLPERIARWSTLNPAIKLVVQEARSRDIVEAVRTGLADVGVVTSTPVTDLVHEPYGRDTLCVIVADKHPLRNRRIAFADLLEHDFVGLDDSAAITQAMRLAAGEAGKLLRLRMQVHSFDAVCRLVAAGQGIGVLPAGTIATFQHAMKIRRIQLVDAWADRQMTVCVKPGGLAVPTARFVAYLLGKSAA